MNRTRCIKPNQTDQTGLAQQRSPRDSPPRSTRLNTSIEGTAAHAAFACRCMPLNRWSRNQWLAAEPLSRSRRL
eukprot:1208166-Alexandrium_andersonii.AAC.1